MRKQSLIPLLFLSVVTFNGEAFGADVPEYKPGSRYSAGERVHRHGKLYQCRSFPYSGYCNFSAFGPGTNLGDRYAWINKGAYTAPAQDNGNGGAVSGPFAEYTPSDAVNENAGKEISTSKAVFEFVTAQMAESRTALTQLVANMMEQVANNLTQQVEAVRTELMAVIDRLPDLPVNLATRLENLEDRQIYSSRTYTIRHGGRIEQNEFNSLYDAFFYLSTKSFRSNATITLRLAEDLTIASAIEVKHPQAHQIIIDGLGHRITSTEKVLILDHGIHLKEVRNVRFNSSSKCVEVMNNSSVKFGLNVYFENCYIAIRAIGNSTVEAQGASFENNGYGVIAGDSSSVDVSRSRFITPQWSALSAYANSVVTATQAEFRLQDSPEGNNLVANTTRGGRAYIRYTRIYGGSQNGSFYSQPLNTLSTDGSYIDR